MVGTVNSIDRNLGTTKEVVAFMEDGQTVVTSGLIGAAVSESLLVVPWNAVSNATINRTA